LAGAFPSCGQPSHGCFIDPNIDRSNSMAHVFIGSEHRWGERVRVDIPVRVMAEGRDTAHCRLNNLSLSGALVRADHALAFPLLIDVHIDSTVQPGTACVVKACVSRKVAHGVGIEWCNFAPPVVKDLLRSPTTRLRR
jgi:hypothetical protein